MIAHLRGTLLEKQAGSIIVDVGGVGYLVTIPVSTYTEIGDVGDGVALHIHTNVREDTLALFGFHTLHEKELFQKFIAITGVGPRLAVTILSGLPSDALIHAIRSADVKELTRIPGVGRKTGERIILELKDKLGGFDASEAVAQAPATTLEIDVVSTLINLGCGRDPADKAVRAALASGTPAEFEPLFRRAMELIKR